MKKTGLLGISILLMVAALAQHPVSWSFTARKVSDKTYEVYMTATLQSGWHLFSQSQPEDAIANPTTFTINNNPLIKLEGKIKENGTMEKFVDKKLGLSANQYSSKVEFVQLVKLKGKVKTNFSGNVEFQTCDDKKCLPPKTVNFNVSLN